MTTENIKTLITLLGFISEDKKGNIWAKKYSNHDNYTITLDFEKSSINYGDKIQKGDDTTSNFSSDENFVVLDCIDRLLTKGYKPQDLTLEKKWKLGRSAKSGKADINVTDGKTGKTILIIECKTWGTEFEKEKDRMRENGGQLFSYFQQDKATRFLCLYTSQQTANLLIQEKFIDYKTAIVKVEDTEEDIRKQDNQIEHTLIYQKATDVAELVKVWNHKNKKQFEERGIFEEEVEPYNPGFVPLRVAGLKEFKQDDAKKEYNEFEEILRHNNISDRSNAFNRFISLVLAKLRDEEINFNKIADFQFKDGFDDNETIIEKLQSLYTDAMYHYLGESVTNYTLDQIENIISHFPRQTAKEDLKRIYKELKFYTNNEFSFKEIYNKELFDQNAKVVIEIVKRLQGFRFKYNAKAQFLGDFFEDMLESGFKQSEGQFFTPTPIAKFIVSAMPLREIIERKISEKESNILPCIIDYACGSGHFITESIEALQDFLQEFKDEQHEKIQDYKKSTEWAESFICGIEKDYRLARTSKVACYMHGDGKAKIIFGDGLENHFEKLPDAVKNGNNFLGFDILVANPPYTIKDFKKHLNKEKLPVYELLPSISDDSDDIEVMFVERTKQLLKDGGFAGIFLPSTILNSAGIYTKAREIILKFFEIKGIVEFGSNTFSATSTNTIVLFMKRRSGDFAKNCLYIAEDFILGKDAERKEDFIDSHKLLQNYAAIVDINITDYKTLLKRNPSAELKKTEYYQNYKKWFDDLTEVKNWKKGRNYEKLTEEQREKYITDWFFDEVLEIEKEKFLYFLLSHRQIEDKTQEYWETVNHPDGTETRILHYRKRFIPQQTLIIKSGKENETQKAFLGYTFSDRRGYKGLDMKKDANGKEITKLYDKENLRNPEKANTYIYRAFRELPLTEIDESIQDQITLLNLVDTFNFDRIEFEKQINIGAEAKINWNTLWNTDKLKTLSELAEIQKGTSITKEKTMPGKIPVVAGGQQAAYFHNVSNRKPNIVTVSASGAYAGYINFWETEIFASDCTTIRALDEKIISTKLIYEFLKAIQSNIYQMQRGQAQPHVYPDDIARIKIPILSNEIQSNIIKEIEKVEKDEKVASSKFKKLQSEIQSKINSLYSSGSYTLVKINNQFKINEDTVNPSKKFGENLFTYIDIDCIGKGNGKISFHKKVKGIEAPSRARRIANNKSAIISTVRPYLKGFAFVDEVPENAVFSTGFAIIRTKDERQYLTELLYYMFMYSENLMQQMEAKMPKASYPSINQADIDDFQIPLIPIKVQEMILSQIIILQNNISEALEIIEKAEQNKMEILKSNLK